jgi:hypothetical protein
VAPKPAEISKEMDQQSDAADFDQSSDLCDFGYVLVRRENNPAGDTRRDSKS